MTWPTRILWSCIACCLTAPASASAHGGDDASCRTTIVSFEPEGLPIDVTMTDGDEIRLENQGDDELAPCGYGTTDGVVRTRVDYVGGQSWMQRFGEQVLVGAGILVMVAAPSTAPDQSA